MQPVFANVQTNISIIAHDISTHDADLIVYPELATSGYFFTDRKTLIDNSLAKDSEAFIPILNAAKESHANVVLGFAERDGDVLYNSSLLITNNGEIHGLYRKVHLFYYEKVMFTAGNLGFPVFDITTREKRQVKVGMQICYDWRFPEATRSLALQGAQIVTIPACIVTKTGMLHDTLRVRAFENKVIVACADRVGSETGIIENKEETLHFRGESCIINYNGEILSRLDDTTTGSITCEVEIEKTVNKNINPYNNILSDRKPKSYIH
jgi:predicted amidohydrolase